MIPDTSKDALKAITAAHSKVEKLQDCILALCAGDNERDFTIDHGCARSLTIDAKDAGAKARLLAFMHTELALAEGELSAHAKQLQEILS